MADLADIANDHVLLQLEDSLAALQAWSIIEEADDCHTCGDPIPEARRRALAGRSCVRCVDCQAMHELRG